MRILLVAMAGSVHTAGWLRQISNTGWDIHLVPITSLNVIPELSNVTVHTQSPYRPAGLPDTVSIENEWPWHHGADALRQYTPWLWKALMRNRIQILTDVIKKFRPQIIHSMPMQGESYAVLEAKVRLRDLNAPWLYSCWGSDLYFYGRQPAHSQKIRAVLKECQYLTADCERDLRLSREYGFSGETLGVFPGPGAFEINELQRFRSPGKPSERKTVMIKGIENWAGRAQQILVALRQCIEDVRPYRIIVYSSSPPVAAAAKQLAKQHRLDITVLPQSSHDTLLKLFGEARVAIGNNVSDGIPNAMLEAMILGAFPIQSDTISTREWVTHGENGFLIQPERPETIADAVRRALRDPQLTDHAAERNVERVRSLDASIVRPRIIALYEHIFETAKNSYDSGNR